MKTSWFNIDMTSNNSPAPYVTSANRIHNGSKGAWTAFSSNTSEPYITPDNSGAGVWVQMDFGEIRKFNMLQMFARNHGTYYVQAPKQIVIHYSLDGVVFNASPPIEIEKMTNASDVKYISVGDTIEAKVVKIETTGLHTGNNNVSIGYINFGLAYINKTLILWKNEYNTYNSGWQTVSSTTPSESQYLSDGIDDLSVLERKVQSIPPIKFNKSEILLNNEGNVFAKTIDLKKYIDIRSMKVEVM